MCVTVKIKVTKEVKLDKILVKAGVRYWLDCEYSEDNGKTWVEAEEDNDETDAEFKKHIPFIVTENLGHRVNDYWNLIIDVNTGIVENWPKDYCIHTHFKVCDDGLYQVLDVDGNVIWDSVKSKYYYVPDFLEIDDDGYGDYLYLDIDGNGHIKDWETQGITSLKVCIERYYNHGK